MEDAIKEYKYLIFKNYVKDKKEGKGIYYFEDGKKFIGTWVNGK